MGKSYPKQFLQRVYEIAGNCCELCRSNQGLSCHHITPRPTGLTIHTLTNCMLLCEKCHKPFTLEEQHQLMTIHKNILIQYCEKWNLTHNEKWTRLVKRTSVL
jgi:5-methylcytosine-specific restriction endonuclease McrA